MDEAQNNLQNLLRGLKQQDANSLRSLLANEVNAVQEILKVSGTNVKWDQRHVGLLLDRWTNVVTLMNLSASSDDYSPKTSGKRPAEHHGPEIVRRALGEPSPF